MDSCFSEYDSTLRLDHKVSDNHREEVKYKIDNGKLFFTPQWVSWFTFVS